MTKFNITTIERWEQRVDYENVEAPSLEEAVQQIRDGDECYSEHEIIESGDEVLYVERASISRSGRELDIPEALSTEPPSYDEVAQLLDNVTASLDTCMAFYGMNMPAADRLHRNALVKQAKAMLRKIYPDHATA